MKTPRWTIPLLAAIVLAAACSGPDADPAVGRDLAYYRAQLAKAAPNREMAAAANRTATEGPKANDAAYARALRETIIPLFESYREDLRRIQPMTESVSQLQRLSLAGYRLMIDGFKDLEKSVRTGDKALIGQARAKFEEGTLLVNRATKQMDELTKRYPDAK